MYGNAASPRPGRARRPPEAPVRRAGFAPGARKGYHGGMRNTRAAFLSLAVVVALCGAAAASFPAFVGDAGDSAPSLPRVARRIAEGGDLRIVAFGSSSTQGVGASSPARSYPARLESTLRSALPGLAGKVVVLNRGIGGEDVDDMLLRVDRDVIAAAPDLVIWQTGSNDPMRKVPLEHFREATAAAVARMRGAGLDVMLMEPQWCPRLEAEPGSARFRDAVRDIARDLGIPVLRRSDLMREWVSESRIDRKDLFAPDGLHMADGGYDLLAKSTADEILRGADAMDGETGEAAAVAVEQ